MAASLSITVRGTAGLKAAMQLGSAGDEILRPAFTAGALVVQNQARRDVHVVSGKLHDSTGTTVTGSGWSTEAHIGPKPGFGGPRVSASGEKGKRANPSRRVNKSDPRDYAARYQFGFHGSDSLGRTFNQEGHRYLVEALNENVAAIDRVVANRITTLMAEAVKK